LPCSSLVPAGGKEYLNAPDYIESKTRRRSLPIRHPPQAPEGTWLVELTSVTRESRNKPNAWAHTHVAERGRLLWLGVCRPRTSRGRGLEGPPSSRFNEALPPLWLTSPAHRWVLGQGCDRRSVDLAGKTQGGVKTATTPPPTPGTRRQSWIDEQKMVQVGRFGRQL